MVSPARALRGRGAEMALARVDRDVLRGVLLVVGMAGFPVGGKSFCGPHDPTGLIEVKMTARSACSSQCGKSTAFNCGQSRDGRPEHAVPL
jgi:hypothetical protein